MTQAVLRISGVAIISVTASLLLKEKNKTAAAVSVLCAIILIFSFSINTGIQEVVETVSTLGSETEFFEYAAVLVKALGIGYITTVTETVCRDAGEGSLAVAVSLGGKIQLLLLSLPMIAELMELAKQLL